MARCARNPQRGEIYHIIQRGLDRRDIFPDEADKEYFLTTLQNKKEIYKIRIYTYIVMDNHYHILLQLLENNLSRFMMSLNTTYAKYWTKKEKRTGYVYQNRFKSIHIKSQEQLLESIRYINLNRVRATGSNTIEKYLYSGHTEIIGVESRRIADRDVVLSLFSRREDKAVEEYKKFVEEGIKLDKEKIKAFVYKEIPEIEVQKKIEKKGRIGEHLGKNSDRLIWTYEKDRLKGQILRRRRSDLLSAVSEVTGVTKSWIRSKGTKSRDAVRCKRLIGYVGSIYMDMTIRELSDYLGVHETTLVNGIREMEAKLRGGNREVIDEINSVISLMLKHPRKKK